MIFLGAVDNIFAYEFCPHHSAWNLGKMENPFASCTVEVILPEGQSRLMVLSPVWSTLVGYKKVSQALTTS